jgi:hypothetical protein
VSGLCWSLSLFSLLLLLLPVVAFESCCYFVVLVHVAVLIAGEKAM